ncbi:MAG TPA: pyrroline-5-carboxylate reductase [Thermodesulfovibrionales bacterium]|nr:pyrroline-5-carboxylate reductase [Thermodesulfovibrionales bacterium]
MIGFIGGGNMAETIIKGIAAKYTGDIMVSEPRDERRAYLEKTYSVKATPRNKDVASNCDIIILAVKPQDMGSVLEELFDAVSEDKTVVSIAAGITLTFLLSRLKTKKIVRVMPNTPALIQEGMSVMSMCECIHDKDIGLIKDIFMSVGRLLVLPEKYMDTVTALSGSGPAFFAYFLEAMIEGAVKMGLGKEDASVLAVQTMLGTARLLDTGLSPSKLREMVTSPGGTTASGLKVFEENGFKEIVIAAIAAATERARELGKS